MQVIKNPVTGYLPLGCVKIGVEVGGPVVEVRTACTILTLSQPNAWVKERNFQGPVTFVIGAMPHGSINEDFTEEVISISNYPLSGALACTKICSAFETHWGVL